MITALCGPRRPGLIAEVEWGTVLAFDGRLTFTPKDRADRVRTHRPPMYAGNADLRALVASPGVRVASGTFRDGLRVVYIYDAEDDGFGYAWNLDWEDGSEWGFAPVDRGHGEGGAA